MTDDPMTTANPDARTVGHDWRCPLPATEPCPCQTSPAPGSLAAIDRLEPLPGMTVLRDLTLAEMQQAMLGLTTPRAAVAALDVVDRHWLRVPTVGVDLTGRTERGVNGDPDDPQKVYPVSDPSVRAMALTALGAREFERVTLDVEMPSGWSVRVTGPWAEVDR